MHIAIIGAGSWGTAVACHLAQSHAVSLYCRDHQRALQMQQSRLNQDFLPDCPLPDTMTITSELASCLQHAELIIIAVPSGSFSDCCEQLTQYDLTNALGIVWLTKGLDHESGQFLNHVAKRILGEAIPTALLTGPSFATEVAKHQPTAVVIASNDSTFATQCQTIFHSPNFRTYINNDLIGAQIGGAVKNIMAIACGIADGLNLGANARAALMTRGLTEMSRLGLAVGAKIETILGLSGVGDLILTCTDDQSRNRRFGLALAAGKNSDHAQNHIKQVVEGANNAFAVNRLAEQHDVSMPIVNKMVQLLNGNVTVDQAINELLARSPRAE